MGTVQKQPEIEYVNLMIEIVNLIIADKELRKAIVTTVIKEEENGEKKTYLNLLQQVEAQAEFVAIEKLHKAIVRQRREIESWIKSMQ